MEARARADCSAWRSPRGWGTRGPCWGDTLQEGGHSGAVQLAEQTLPSWRDVLG